MLFYSIWYFGITWSGSSREVTCFYTWIKNAVDIILMTTNLISDRPILFLWKLFDETEWTGKLGKIVKVSTVSNKDSPFSIFLRKIQITVQNFYNIEVNVSPKTFKCCGLNTEYYNIIKCNVIHYTMRELSFVYRYNLQLVQCVCYIVCQLCALYVIFYILCNSTWMFVFNCPMHINICIDYRHGHWTPLTF